MWEIKFTSHKHYLCGRLFSRNAKKTQTDQVHTLKVFYSVQIFSSVYIIDITCFEECFFIPCDNWKTLFFMKVCR